MLHLSPPEARALVAGEIVVAFADRGAVTEGDEVAITPTTQLPADNVKPAYRRWLESDIGDDWTGVAVSVDPATILDPEAGQSRHVRRIVPGGDLIVLRVYGTEGPVLSDEAFAARQKSVEGALRS